jgi:putative flavoprotein involved in K+ transport
MAETADVIDRTPDPAPHPERFDTIVIGGGQAGLSVGYFLARHRRSFVILDAHDRIGDAWRMRWDSLRLFTPARYAGLEGMPFPASGGAYLTKDEFASFLEDYAAKFRLPVRTGVRVDRLSRDGDLFLVVAGQETFEAPNVVVAMGNYQTPRIPAYAKELDPGIVQIHSGDYRNPAQLAGGAVLVVGVGNSGADISLETAQTHQTWLAGQETSHIPFRIEGFVARNILIRIVRFVGHHVLTVRTPIGRKLRPKLLHKGAPLIRVKPSDLAAAGIKRSGRITGVRDGKPMTEDGQVLDVHTVVWCTGFRPGFSWIDLPVLGDHQEPDQERGIAPAEPGLYFVGLHFLYSMTSDTITGVGRDAQRVVKHLTRRTRAGSARFFRVRLIASAIALAALVAGAVPMAFRPSTVLAATTPVAPSFSNTPLPRPDGDSEPEISIAPDGTLGVIGLRWLWTGSWSTQGTHLWTGPFGSTPTFRGLVDNALQQSGKTVGGGWDGDVDMGSTGTLHITTLVALINPQFNSGQLGVSSITCPDAESPTFSIASCTGQVIGTTTSDRPWITSDGLHVYITYNDPARAGRLIVQRSDDDGYTWKRVGDPEVSSDPSVSGGSPVVIEGNLAANPSNHDVYVVYASGDQNLLAGGPRVYPGPDRIVVARSTDLGQSWSANTVYQASPGTDLMNVFPSVAVDPSDGNVSATWSDGSNVYLSTSLDQGGSWPAATVVNTAPALTAVLPWVATRNGQVDVVYYGADSANTSSAIWNVYLAETTDGVSFTQSLVSNQPNHVGVLCTHGDACPTIERTLLDLFQLAFDPVNGKVAIVLV